MEKKTFDSSAESNDGDSSIEDDQETKAQTNKEKDDKKDKEEEIPKVNLELIKAISKTLTMILEENKKLINYKEIVKNQSKMPFSAKTVPSISIYDYLIRIQTYSGIEKSTMILSLIFIDRICEIAELTLTYYNIHRILFGSVLMAIKYNEDNYYDNKYYADIAGVSLKELKFIEYTFTELTDFRLFVSGEQYEKYREYLENYEKIQNNMKIH